jgi:hypothetical protein
LPPGPVICGNAKASTHWFLRIQFPGAVCQVTSQGDWREPIFVADVGPGRPRGQALPTAQEAILPLAEQLLQLQLQIARQALRLTTSAALGWT